MILPSVIIVTLLCAGAVDSRRDLRARLTWGYSLGFLFVLPWAVDALLTEQYVGLALLSAFPLAALLIAALVYRPRTR